MVPRPGNTVAGTMDLDPEISRMAATAMADTQTLLAQVGKKSNDNQGPESARKQHGRAPFGLEIFPSPGTDESWSSAPGQVRNPDPQGRPRLRRKWPPRTMNRYKNSASGVHSDLK